MQLVIATIITFLPYLVFFEVQNIHCGHDHRLLCLMESDPQPLLLASRSIIRQQRPLVRRKRSRSKIYKISALRWIFHILIKAGTGSHICWLSSDCLGYPSSQDPTLYSGGMWRWAWMQTRPRSSFRSQSRSRRHPVCRIPYSFLNKAMLFVQWRRSFAITQQPANISATRHSCCPLQVPTQALIGVRLFGN